MLNVYPSAYLPSLNYRGLISSENDHREAIKRELVVQICKFSTSDVHVHTTQQTTSGFVFDFEKKFGGTRTFEPLVKLWY